MENIDNKILIPVTIVLFIICLILPGLFGDYVITPILNYFKRKRHDRELMAEDKKNQQEREERQRWKDKHGLRTF